MDNLCGERCFANVRETRKTGSRGKQKEKQRIKGGEKRANRQSGSNADRLSGG